MASMYFQALLLAIFVSVMTKRLEESGINPTNVATASKFSAAELATALKQKTFIDLTHAFHPGTGDWTSTGQIPHFAAFPNSNRSRLFTTDESVFPYKRGESGSGFFAEMFCHVGQWGTHVDPPVHFTPNGRKLDQILTNDMVAPLIVLDISTKSASDYDAELTLEDIAAHEKEHGEIPAGSFVALRTDYYKKFETGKLYEEDTNKVKHYPNWSLKALKYLYETRNVLATGHEQTDTDPGRCISSGGKEDSCSDWELRKATVNAILEKADLTAEKLGGSWVYSFANEFYVLSRDTYQIEMLANLDELPPTGAMIVASFPKPKDGSGFPARVFAITDKSSVQ